MFCPNQVPKGLCTRMGIRREISTSNSLISKIKFKLYVLKKQSKRLCLKAAISYERQVEERRSRNIHPTINCRGVLEKQKLYNKYKSIGNNFICRASTGEVATSDSSENVTSNKIGVLLLNLGGPETLDDVQPFLYNLFADPDIIRLPTSLQWLQKPLAYLISMNRAPKSAAAYASIGGGSPLKKITDEQAEALRLALQSRGIEAQVYVGMRYWYPFTEEAITRIKEDGISQLVVLPLYPQFSISTSGSSLRLLEQLFREDQYLINMPHTVIPSWYQRPGYVSAMADLIEKERDQVFEDPSKAVIFFSAHGVPVSYVEDAGDPYKAEMEQCVDLIMQELGRRGVNNTHTLAYQSRVGPVEWLKPYTDSTIKELGASGVKDLLAVPISFVSEHIETLEEIDMEYRELAEESGITNWGRVPALNCNPVFIQDLAEAVEDAVPYAGVMATQTNDTLVPGGSVVDLLSVYDRERLPPPDNLWDVGHSVTEDSDLFTTTSTFLIFAALLLVGLELATGNNILSQFGLF
eukprot:CAMPEP_0196589496 /NCGR_PEP_ID=MMETSP1081-20130531/63710_1 /TAXON_ID=36882 /ORGANISM="Pyramimonas amylifera, Strain CCMP720" /LENGTH=522 /DNA_ID=CAMNT_0041912315 /DNA_START=236 /DNA_END=1804 /DNA_ORIENTATION=-